MADKFHLYTEQVTLGDLDTFGRFSSYFIIFSALRSFPKLAKFLLLPELLFLPYSLLIISAKVVNINLGVLNCLFCCNQSHQLVFLTTVRNHLLEDTVLNLQQLLWRTKLRGHTILDHQYPIKVNYGA